MKNILSMIILAFLFLDVRAQEENEILNMFGIDSLGNLLKSYDAGFTSDIVEESGDWSFLRENIYYDKDLEHLYTITKKDGNYYLYVSDNFGNEDSWELLFSSPSKISLSVDKEVTGKFIFSAENRIYQSSNFGDYYIHLYDLPSTIVGVFTVPNSDTLYAATDRTIYKLFPHSFDVIKKTPYFSDKEFYPLQIGNRWYYKVIDGLDGETLSYSYEEIIGDTLMPNGKSYFVLYNQSNKYWPLSKFVRTDENGIFYYNESDSSDSHVYKYRTPLEMYYNIAMGAAENDSPRVALQYYGNNFVFDDTVNAFNFYLDYLDYLVPFSTTFSEGFGPTSYFTSHHEPISTVCVGAIINGIVYGDTTVVGIENVVNNLPTEFSLSQNYPNPFNPTTTIEYTIPKSRNIETFIRLNIFDVLGSEVATLVNQQQKPGNYQVTFNANDYSSGVYYYQLKTDNLIQTKKMIVMK